jgi:hypothetical protein
MPAPDPSVVRRAAALWCARELARLALRRAEGGQARVYAALDLQAADDAWGRAWDALDDATHVAVMDKVAADERAARGTGT